MKILFVCVGNVCRSCLAAGILKKKFKEKKIDGYVDSAGLEPHNLGQKCDERTFQIAKKYNIDISDHRMRLFSKKDYDEFDKIYVMDQADLRGVKYMARDEEDSRKVEKIMNLITPEKNVNVPNPYFGKLEEFESIYHQLDKACNEFINQINSFNHHIF